jgi:hypothetical protein
MAYKAVVWSDVMSGVAVIERLPCQASAGNGASLYARDLVLSVDERPEYESLAEFIRLALEDGGSFDWKDLTILNAKFRVSIPALKEQFRDAGLVLRTYRPKGVGESLGQYRERIREENSMTARIDLFTAMVEVVSPKLSEEQRGMILATVRKVNEVAFDAMSQSDRVSALVELACSQAKAGDPSKATDALNQIRLVLAETPKTPAAIARNKAVEASIAARKLVAKAEILAKAELYDTEHAK